MTSQTSQHFTIFQSIWNTEPWVEKSFGSALTQDYDCFDVILIDDASDDRTFERCQAMRVEHAIQGRLTIVRNPQPIGMLANLIFATRAFCREDTVIVMLDGDDWLIDSRVLEQLDVSYAAEIWLTSGSFVDADGQGYVVPPPDNETFWRGNIREKPWQLSHLKTFRKALFDRVRHEDLMDGHGHFLDPISDMALMFPMAEMAGPDHYRASRDPLYVYNRSNPLSLSRRQRNEQKALEKQLRSLASYDRLERL